MSFKFSIGPYTFLFGRASTVPRILKGSRTLDVMEQDIERFCRLTLWLLNDFFEKRSDCTPSGFHHVDYFDLTDRHGDVGYYWQLILSDRAPCGIRIWKQSEVPFFEYKVGKKTHFEPDGVEEVYDKLESLRKGVLREFPFMSIKYAPYVKASKRY
ncbi:MAG: hypothetical protein ACAH17_03595 [Candidatus Paceibacterota bacterium]